MPTEVVSTYQIWADPALWQALGGLIVILLLLYWRYRFPDSYKHTKKWVLKSGNTIIQGFNVVGLMVSISIMGILALNTYSENTIIAIQTSSPELYSVIFGYKTFAEVVFVGFVILLFIGRTVTHHWNAMDNGVIDDPDQKRWDDRKQLEDIGRDMRIEEVEKNRQLSEERWQKAFEKLTEMYVASQNAIYDIKGEKEGRQKPEGLYTGPEKRSLVRDDPTVPLTEEEVLAKVLPVEILEEKPLPPEDVSESENETKKEEKHETVNPYQYNKLDQMFGFGKKHK